MPVVDSPKYDSTEFTDVPYLESAVIFDEETKDLVLFAVNRDLEETLQLECEMRGFGKYKIREHIVYESGDKKARNTKGEPFKVIPHNKGNAIIQEDTVIAGLPKLSWNVIRLMQKEVEK